MGRRPNDSPNKVSQKEEVWAQAVARGETRADAEREAGYTSGTSSRLLKRAAVMRRVSELQRPYIVTWKRLLVKAQHILDDHLDSANELAAALLGRLESNGYIEKKELQRFLKLVSISAADKNAAARLVMDAMAKINPKSLTDAASAEDEIMGRDEAVRKIIGADAEGEVASTDAPPDPDAEEADDGEPDEVTH